MPTKRRIYLDNAATSWPKPDAVYTAVDNYMRNNGAPAGRSGYAEAADVSRLVDGARRELAKLLRVRDARRLIFAVNGTDALNMVLYGLLRDGDHVVTTAVEHNSTLRPLRALEEAGRIRVTRVKCGASGVLDPDDVAAALAEKTRLVAVSHASNVTGAIQPIEQIRDLAHEHGALILVDAAQTFGHQFVELDEWNMDFVAASGHKGLLGPLGTGVLYLRAGMENQLASVRQGGTGTRSEDDRQPDELPGKYESGNLNVPGIAGLGAAATYLFGKSLIAVRDHEQQLTGRLYSGLAEMPRVRVYGPRKPDGRAGLVSISIEGYDPQEVAAALDAVHRIQVRPGLHCAPRMHEALGTLATGGTVRFSLGWFNTDEDVDATLFAVAQLVAAT